MTHSNRNSYKDKATMAAKYKTALIAATAAAEGLEAELRLREEREEELLHAVTSLIQPAIKLSGTLRGCAGDFGTGVYIPRTDVDTMLNECRPAVVAQRASVLMNLAVARLEELHLEADDAEGLGENLLLKLGRLEETTRRSKERRRKLLITGMLSTTSDESNLDERTDEYSYDKSSVKLEEVYEVEGIALSEAETESPDAPTPVKKQRSATKRFEKKHRRLFS